MSMIEARLQLVLDKLSNNEPVEYKEEWIEEAGEMFKEGLRKQLKPREQGFRIRMSNIGRPLCVLQREKAGDTPSRNPYSFIVKMMLGDATEVLVNLYLKMAKIDITGGKRKVELDINGTVIQGENDEEIENAVYDTKSASPWSFDNKWAEGWEGLKKDDSFGYGPQLWGYSKAAGMEPGGWIVVNKSTGDIKVVPASFSKEDARELEARVSRTVDALVNDAPFEKCFEPQDEYFRRQPTGNKRLPMNCTFCPFMKQCWPDAKYRPQTGSQARSPRHYWYAEYSENAL